MSKHKKKQSMTIQIPLLKNPSIVTEFQEYLQKYGNKKSTILDFLDYKDTYLYSLLGMDGNPDTFDRKVKEGIVEFYDFFMAKYDAITWQDRQEMFGTDSLVLMLGAYFDEQFLYEKQKAELEMVSEDILEEAKSLAESIWNLRADRTITFALADGHGHEISDRLFLEKYIPKEYLDMHFTFLLYDCVAMLLSFGSAVIRLTYKNKNTEIFGVYTDAYNCWQPVSAKAMEDAHTLCPDGTRLEPEDGVDYIAIIKQTK